MRLTSDFEPSTLKRDLEALLFAAGDAITVENLLEALGCDTDDPAQRDLVVAVLQQIQTEFSPGGERGFELARLSGGWAFRTNPRCRETVAKLFELPEEATRLSSAAMECLSVVAYLQPVSRPQIAEIRGVNSDSPMRTLLDRELITEVGRVQGGGGALLYGTTQRFEAIFGLAGVDDLPPIEGFALNEEQKEDLRRRLGLLTVPE
jgi:segregation and condensation protein B